MDRVLLLLPTTTYRTQAFVDAARTLGVDLVCASERPSTLEAHAPESLITLDFDRPAAAAAAVARFASARRLDAVVGVDDRTAEAAAAIAARLGLKASAPAAVHAPRDKHEMRERLAAAGVPAPRFRLVRLADAPARLAADVAHPGVLKPPPLSATPAVNLPPNPPVSRPPSAPARPL